MTGKSGQSATVRSFLAAGSADAADAALGLSLGLAFSLDLGLGLDLELGLGLGLDVGLGLGWFIR